MSSKGLVLGTCGMILVSKVIIIILAEHKPLNKIVISESLVLWIIIEKNISVRELKLFLIVECQLVNVERMIKLENHYFSNNWFKQESEVDTNNSG